MSNQYPTLNIPIELREEYEDLRTKRDQLKEHGEMNDLTTNEFAEVVEQVEALEVEIRNLEDRMRRTSKINNMLDE